MTNLYDPESKLDWTWHSKRSLHLEQSSPIRDPMNSRAFVTDLRAELQGHQCAIEMHSTGHKLLHMSLLNNFKNVPRNSRKMSGF